MKLGLFFEYTKNRNNTEKVFIDIFKEEFETSFFTIDNSKKLDTQIRSFIDSNELLIMHLYSFVYFDKFAKKKINIEYFSDNFKAIIQNHTKILEIAKESKKPILILFTRSDWYNHSSFFWELIPKNAYLLGGFKKGYINENPSNDFIFEKFGKNITLGNEYISDNKIIPLHHVLDEYEFKSKPSVKKYDISVLGVLYNRRRKVYDKLTNNRNINLYNPKVLLRLRKLLNSFDKRQFGFNHMILSYLFKEAIKKSKLSYTDGSTLNMFVRKYIEIPALNTLLFCEPFMKMNDFGFENGINFLKVDYDYLDEQIEDIVIDDKKRELITQNGYKLVKSNFSKSSWIPRMKTIFTKIKTNTLNEVKWEDRTLKIR
jgi:hypothetical protein